jgi:cytoskeleton protein RodZ
MSDEQDKPVDATSDDEPDELRGGERLAVARRERQISVLEVAKELHLDEPKVRALESNEFDVLGAPVFAKGHLRKYAQLVGVDEADILADYYHMTRAESLPPVVKASKVRVRQELSPGPWIAVIVVLIVAAASYWWFAVQSDTAVVSDAMPEETLPIEQSGGIEEAADETVISAAALPNAQREINRPEEQPAVSEPVEAAVDATLADGESRLTLVYSGDCWTEISDATGRRLLFDMGRSGRTVELTGRAPFSVLLGNVDNVDVSVNGRDYPITTTNPGGRTARLTITNL